MVMDFNRNEVHQEAKPLVQQSKEAPNIPLELFCCLFASVSVGNIDGKGAAFTRFRNKGYLGAESIRHLLDNVQAYPRSRLIH